ncbi:monovalent cation/H(+) antiporter subunit G [Streptomyces sp. NRRL S-87]|uniref:monovalent cation/H(+) antiporter subunit G n=1 Tax=Streptomyces sp. NRRL S-87 TaxID=1463920 RepID=UPI0004C0944E|nr:monovalent cation/H(+) antiporter subunit G [Streptomyces sp. NRRL S-87]
MTPRAVCAGVLAGAGVSVVLLSALSLAVLSRPYARLHALSPAASLGLPLIALALAVAAGPGRQAVKLLLLALLVVGGGSLTTMAVGRVTAQAEGRLERDAPP